MKKSLGAATIALPLPAWVIGTYDADGRANVMTASWAGVCNSKPPSVYFAARHGRYTYDCVVATKAFTVMVPGVAQAAATDFFGIASGRKVDKLAKAGMTAHRAEHVDAPVVDEFPLVLECRLSHTIELGSHVMLIGEIMDVKCDEDKMSADGKIDAAKIATFTYCPGDSKYYAVGDAMGGGYELGRGLADK